MRGGRFFSGVGYLNEQHAHTWDFADQALPYQAFLNTQYDDDGVQLRWLAPTSQFLEFGGEAFRGDAFPAGGTDNHNSGVGAWSGFVHTGNDIGDSASYRVGLSYLHTAAKNRSTDDVDGFGVPVTDIFSGTDNTYIADGVFKWAPNGNFVDRYLKLQGEFFLRREQGAFNGVNFSATTQTGFYTQGVYQFMPQWRVGLRYDQLHADSLGAEFRRHHARQSRRDAAALHRDDRLLHQRIRPLPPAIRERPLAAADGERIHPAIHHQPRRPRRPSVLRGNRP